MGLPLPHSGRDVARTASPHICSLTPPHWPRCFTLLGVPLCRSRFQDHLDPSEPFINPNHFSSFNHSPIAWNHLKNQTLLVMDYYYDPPPCQPVQFPQSEAKAQIIPRTSGGEAFVGRAQNHCAVSNASGKASKPPSR